MRRVTRRLLVHHLPIGLVTCASGIALYGRRTFPDVIANLSFASAYPALILVSVALLIGPFKLISRKPLPVSIDLRRDIGIWAGMTGVFHAAVGQFVHLRGRPWLYYVYEDWRDRRLPVRHDLAGLANYTGLLATLILLLLLATSNDASLRYLRAPSWKKLQRWNYAGFVLIAIHTLLYQIRIEGQAAPFVSVAAISIILTLLVQWQGYRLRAKQIHRSVEQL